ncbi:MAG: gamma-butyrobetaine hydroxylase-like domain-containing protein [Chloroflexota bacterium]
MTPTGIEADRGAGTLTIDWDDGHHSIYSLPALRWACPCAECKGEWGRPGRLASLQSLPPLETKLIDMEQVGGYAIKPIWAAGHAQGIYSWEYLRGICPCQECVTAAATE